MAHVSHKLSNSVEGALAAGGDPATSPLYVFGPFLRLIVAERVLQRIDCPVLLVPIHERREPVSGEHEYRR